MKWVVLAGLQGPDWFRRLGTALFAGVLAAGLVLQLGGQDMQTLAALGDQVTQLEKQWAEQQDTLVKYRPSPGMAAAERGPAPGDEVMLWPWLQQRLQLHGLRMLSLKPQPSTTEAGLPQQPAVLRLQGQWRDWLAFEGAFRAHAPWWVIDQWQMAPTASGDGEISIELQLRFGFMPRLPASAGSSQMVWPNWAPSGQVAVSGSELFTPSPAAIASRATPGRSHAKAASSDPAASAHQWRLLGIWRQANRPYAVLFSGQEVLTLGAGDAVGPEGYRLVHVDDSGVRLASRHPDKPPLILTLEGPRP